MSSPTPTAAVSPARQAAELGPDELVPSLEEAFAVRLAAASMARDHARDAFAATVRDALDAGLSEGQVAKILGIKARAYIYKLRDADATAHAGTPKPPPRQPVVFLRGAGVPNAVWLELEHLFWARQWATTTKRQEAWHLARGGTPVVFVDFSKRTADDLKVAGVRAVYRGTSQKEVLELINGGTVDVPRLVGGALDTAAVALLVQQVIGDLPAINERRRLAASATASAPAAGAGPAGPERANS